MNTLAARLSQLLIVQQFLASKARRVIVFSFVGGFGVIVNLVVMYLVGTLFHLHGEWASVIASAVAIVNNYILHERVTWSDRAGGTQLDRGARMASFLFVSLVNLGIAALFVRWFVDMNLADMLGQLCGIVVGTVWSYLANNLLTWRSR